MTSTRLPGKVLEKALGRPMLDLMIERLRNVVGLQRIVLATTTNATDDPVEVLARRLGVSVYRGSERDVMRRVLGAAQAHGIDVIVETTGDCPLIDPPIVEIVVDAFHRGAYDYVANNTTPSYPDGMDVRVFPTSILADAESRTRDPYDREHVTPYIYRNPRRYRCADLQAPPFLRWSELRLTLDTAEDLVRIRRIFEALYPVDRTFHLSDMLGFLRRTPDLLNDDARSSDPEAPDCSLAGY